jgi:hypothetical protein
MVAWFFLFIDKYSKNRFAIQQVQFKSRCHMDNDIFALATFILTQQGEMQIENRLTLEAAYRDERVEIAGLINPQTREFEAVYININLPSQADAKPGMIEYTAPFTIPKSEPVYETLVYQWRQGNVHFQRRGLWEAYLAHIVRKFRVEIETLKLLNGVPIDDVTLFADIPLNMSS